MVHSIFESFQNKSNPFRTPLFNVKCQETNSNATAPTTAVERKISAASVKGKLRIKCVLMRRQKDFTRECTSHFTRECSSHY